MSTKPSASKETTKASPFSSKRASQQNASYDVSSHDEKKAWHVNGSHGLENDSFCSDFGEVSDYEVEPRTSNLPALHSDGDCRKGKVWQSDSSEDSRTRRDRLETAGLALHHYDVTDHSAHVPLDFGNMKSAESNGRSESFDKYIQELSHEAKKRPLPSKVIDGLTSDFDDDDIVYEADSKSWVDSSDYDDFPDDYNDPSQNEPSFAHGESDLPIDPSTAHLRRDSSGSIHYEADAETETKDQAPPSAENPPPEVTVAHAEGKNAFDDTISTFVQAAINEDSDMTALVVGEEAQATLHNFVMEHRIFAKALLALLAQRDQHRPDEMDMDSPIIKAGPLKKASHLVRGVWRIKYVEVRKGMFSYYEDVEHEEGQLSRKNIPLDATSLTCRPVKVHQNALSLNPASGGAIFELTEEGGPRRLWMANSKEERQAWMRAIQDATVGGSLTRGGENNRHDNKYKVKRQVQRSPYRKDLERYLKIQKEIKNSTSKDTYLGALSKLLGLKLNVPVQWITEQATAADENDKAFYEDNASGVDQLWKDLLRDTVSINGELFQGRSGHSPEKIIGALTRNMMEFDRTSPLHAADHEQSRRKNLISELQALSFARDILLSGNRTRSGGDSYFCVDTLCHHKELVVTVPNSLEAEPWKITITHAVPTKTSTNVYSLNDRSGWLKTRSKTLKPWKRRFFVFSGGTLSYYEKALPRPHGLRGQIKIVDYDVVATRVQPKGVTAASFDKNEVQVAIFLVSILNKDCGLARQILFEDEDKFLAWAHGFEDALKKKTNVMTSPQQKYRFRMRPHLGLRDELDQGVIVRGITLGDESLVDNAKNLGLDSAKVSQRMIDLSNQGGKGQSTVRISIEASTDYNVCTTDPQGNIAEDTWATIRATFLQSFSVCGGQNGRIARGEEIVRIKILKCSHFRRVLDSSTTPRELAEMVSRKLRRFGNQDGGFL